MERPTQPRRRVSPHFTIYTYGDGGYWCLEGNERESLLTLSEYSLVLLLRLLEGAKLRLEEPSSNSGWQIIGQDASAATHRLSDGGQVEFALPPAEHSILLVEDWEVPALLGGLLALAQEFHLDRSEASFVS